MIPEHCINGSYPGAAGSINTFAKFKTIFAFTLTDIAWTWYEPIKNNIPNMSTVQEKYEKV